MDPSAQHVRASWSVTSVSTSPDSSATARRCFLLQVHRHAAAGAVLLPARSTWPRPPRRGGRTTGVLAAHRSTQSPSSSSDHDHTSNERTSSGPSPLAPKEIST
jgi:hypothetical protein